jgi:hypothetical protein
VESSQRNDQFPESGRNRGLAAGKHALDIRSTREHPVRTKPTTNIACHGADLWLSGAESDVGTVV